VQRLFVLFFLLLFTRTAHADEVAPDLEGSDLRVRAQSEVRRLYQAMPPADQRRLTGVYAAFDSSVSDPIAQVACDDDGDYVILFSDAMLRLISHVARAETHDEATGNRRLSDYATFLARSQIAGRRLLPPPPGFFRTTVPWSPEVYEARLTETLSFVAASELARLRAQELVCPKPTPTKESGDDVWTAAESRKAAETAAKIYRSTPASHDTTAMGAVLDVGHTDRGGLAILQFFVNLETTPQSTFLPTYLMHHPGSAARKANAEKVAVDRHRE